jgi:hypothetical protein
MKRNEPRTSAERMLMLWGREYTCRHVEQMIVITEHNPNNQKFWEEVKTYVDLIFKKRTL